MPLDYAIQKPKSGNATSAVIMLHGVGSDGENLIGLAPYLAEVLPDTVFISPNAPFQYDMFPSGYQWFSLTDRDPKRMLEGVKKVLPIVDQFIDNILSEYNLPPEKLALLGFSQGTMTSLFVAPRRAKKLAGVIGFSGALLAPELLSEAKSKLDICLIHGEEDDIVPFYLMEAAAAALQETGFKVEAHVRPNLPHSIDMEGIEIAAKFLKERI